MLLVRSNRSSQRVTFQDNVARHVDELRAAGASESDLDDLRAAAAGVQSDPGPAAGSIAAATAPYTTFAGAVVQPPTKAARYWASAAVARVTGGVIPERGPGLVQALLAGLAVLRLWGDGRKDEVMAACSRPGVLPDLIADEASGGAPADPEALAADYAFLMGLDLKKKAKPAPAATLSRTLTRLRKRYGLRTAGCSGKASPRASRSG